MKKPTYEEYRQWVLWGMNRINYGPIDDFARGPNYLHIAFWRFRIHIRFSKRPFRLTIRYITDEDMRKVIEDGTMYREANINWEW